MELQMTMRTSGGMGARGVVEGAAVDHDGVVLLAAADDELVHDADVGSDEVVLRALAEQGDLAEGHCGGSGGGGRWDSDSAGVEAPLVWGMTLGSLSCLPGRVADSGRVMGTPSAPRTANAVATSTEAEELRPAPSGTSPAMVKEKPPEMSKPRSRKTQRTPAG